MNFYKNVIVHRGKLLIRGVFNGKDYSEKLDFSPVLYAISQEQSKYKTLQGQNLKPIEFNSIADARKFKRECATENSPIFGLDRFQYQYIGREYPNQIEWSRDYIKIFSLDIETTCENGFPDVNNPTEQLLCITIKNQINKQIITWGVGDFHTDRTDVTYIKCKSENQLIMEFMKFWIKNYPDVITGWNTKFFDVPYLMSRIKLVTEKEGDAVIKKMSPWKLIERKEIFYRGKDQTVYDIFGIVNLDYLELYRLFVPQKQESYKLDFIGEVELGQNKNENPYDTFKEFYENDFQKFVDYNIQDVELVDALEDKLRLIDLSLTIAYESKVNYDDIFSQVRMWDTLIANHLMSKDICVPPREEQVKDSKYVGAYVKEPKPGLYKWVVSFDINSLYPHIIIQYNISPEKILGVNINEVSIETMLNGDALDIPVGSCITPNGALFKTDSQGFLPEMMETMYKERVIYKNKMLDAKQRKETTGDKSIDKEISRYHNIQWARKIALNSAYGAIGNQYFRYYDVRQASGITTAGQFIIRFIESQVNKYLNKILQKEINKDYIVASDTDSIYVTLDELVNKTCKGKTDDQIANFLGKVCDNKIEPFIEKCFNELSNYTNAYKNAMVMKREVITNKAIWVAKKRYMMNVLDEEGVRLAKPKMKIMGIEAVKSSTPQVCRGKIKEAINIIMSKDENELQQFIQQFKEDFFKLTAEQISFPRSCNNLKKYASSTSIFIKGTPIHVKGALIYNYNIKRLKLQNKYPLIQDGDKIKFIKLLEQNPFRFDVISYVTKLTTEFKLQECIDYEIQFQKTFLDPMRFILEAIGWQAEKKATLEDFFA